MPVGVVPSLRHPGSHPTPAGWRCGTQADSDGPASTQPPWWWSRPSRTRRREFAGHTPGERPAAAPATNEAVARSTIGRHRLGPPERLGLGLAAGRLELDVVEVARQAASLGRCRHRGRSGWRRRRRRSGATKLSRKVATTPTGHGQTRRGRSVRFTPVRRPMSTSQGARVAPELATATENRCHTRVSRLRWCIEQVYDWL